MLYIIAKEKKMNYSNYEFALKSGAKKIRFICVGMNKLMGNKGELWISRSINISNVYDLPENVSLKEAFKFVSMAYKDSVEFLGLGPKSRKSGILIPKLLEDYGLESNKDYMSEEFCDILTNMPEDSKEIELKHSNAIPGILDLIVFVGDRNLFERTKLSKRYFDWFDKDVTEKEFQRIYNKINNPNKEEQQEANA